MLRNLHNEKRQTQGGAEDAATTHHAAVRRRVCTPTAAVRYVVRPPRHRGVRLLPAVLLLPFAFYLFTSCAHAQSGGVWGRQSSGTLAWLHGVHFVDAERGWAAGGAGILLRTTDGGANWKAVAPRPTEDTLRDVYFADAQTGWLVCDRSLHKLQAQDEPRSYLLRTTDGGETWKRVEATGADADIRLVRILFADRERGWVFGEAGALYATDDGGATWHRQRAPTRHLLLGGAFLDAQQGWLVGAGATILSTDNGGATWREGRVEMPSADAAPADNAPGATNASVSTPNVATSTPARASSVSNRSATASSASARAPSARLRAVSFVDARKGWAVGSGGRIFVTKDGGRTWRAQQTEMTGDLFDVKFFDEREGWATGEGGHLLHTTDGGAHWRIVRSGTTHPLERLFFASRTRGWAVGFGGTIVALAPATQTHAPRFKAAR